MSVEIRSAAPSPVIRAGSMPGRGLESGGKAPFMTMTSRTVEAPKIGIAIPTPGEKPSFMSISKRMGGERPLINLERGKPHTNSEKVFSDSQKTKLANSLAQSPQTLMARPTTEAAKAGDKSFAQVMREKQAKFNQPVGDRTRDKDLHTTGFRVSQAKPVFVSRPETTTQQPVKPEGAVGKNASEIRPIGDSKRISTPVVRETHRFYQPVDRPEMTGRVVIKPREVASSSPQRKEGASVPRRENGIPSIPFKTQEMPIVPEIKKSAEVVATQTSTPDTKKPHLHVVRPDQIHIPQNIENNADMTQSQAIEALKKYAKTPKAERQTTPEIKQAFQKVIEPAKTPLTSAVAALWQGTDGAQTVPGVSPEALTHLKTIIDKDPELKRKVDAQLKIATVIMANYAEIGYPIIMGGTVVLQALEVTIRKEIREALKPETAPALPESEEQKDGGEDPKEHEDVGDSDEGKVDLSFMRDEKVNSIRFKELVELADILGVQDEEQKVKMVSPKAVSQIWKLTTQNVSTLIKDGGVEQRRVDGSWDEIVKDMETWKDMSLAEFKTQIHGLILAKTAVAQGKNPYATQDDVQRVLTVPVEYSTFRMNRQQHEYQQAA